MSAERLATAVQTSDLGSSDLAIKDVEFCGAMAGTSGLSSDLFRSKDGDGAALRRAVLKLAVKAIKAGMRSRRYLSRDQARTLAIAALAEIIKPNCRTCYGAAVVVTDDLKIICPDCAGVSVHRYSDSERARLCKVKRENWRQWEGRYLMVLEIALRHDCAPGDAAARLG